jgi:hypothetical protein
MAYGSGQRSKPLLSSAGARVARLVISSPREHPHLATNRAHEGVTIARGRIMRAQRVWKPVGPVKNNAEIERLRLELAAFNERIEELEKQHPEASRIEVLRAGALMLARQIDELRSSSVNDLTDLLAK